MRYAGIQQIKASHPRHILFESKQIDDSPFLQIFFLR